MQYCEGADSVALIHGGDTEGYRLVYGNTPLDFSANCNPLGVPESVRQAIRDTAGCVDVYGDPLCRRLCAAIGKKIGVPHSQILCGNGAVDLIYRAVLARKPRHAVVTAPTFAEYELALEGIGCKVIRHPLQQSEGFLLTDRILACLKEETEVLFLCNPNNPTGLTIEPALLQYILKTCEKKDIFLVVDECFNGFLSQPEKHTLRPYLSQCSNLLLLDAFTKLYGMAGVRLGYCLSSNHELLEDMRQAGQPWAVSSLAQEAGIAALEEDQYVRETRVLIGMEKEYLLERLKDLGINVLGSEANYIFFSSEIPDLAKGLCEKGILIRDCSNYAGLTRGYYRIAVRTHSENLRLIKGLVSLVGESCG